MEDLRRTVHIFDEQLDLLDAFAKLLQEPCNGSRASGFARRQNIQPHARGEFDLEFQSILVWGNVRKGGRSEGRAYALEIGWRDGEPDGFLRRLALAPATNNSASSSSASQCSTTGRTSRSRARKFPRPPLHVRPNPARQVTGSAGAVLWGYRSRESLSKKKRTSSGRRVGSWRVDRVDVRKLDAHLLAGADSYRGIPARARVADAG